jgi:peptidoglycan hydrolase-like protein with peptidoglycan-binding domain
VSPTTLSAANPIRVFAVGGIKKGELKPAIKLDGIGITPYGFLKATFIHDSSSPGGDDFPLPGFLGDTGPTAAPEFHVKARSTRLGTNFEWLDSNPKLSVTGKFEMDFEGNFNRSDNRNLSSIRSYNPSIRLAYGRLDYKLSADDTITTVLGQDWVSFGSSTLPNMLETTGLGIAFGDLYERAPQFRLGYTHNFGSFQIMPEVAMVLPAIGLPPSAANISQQLGYGERQGPDSNSPQVEGRIVGQWQLDHAPGVSPAQLIVSFQEGHSTAIVLGSAVPTAYKSAFPTGANVSSATNGVDFEWQLPTRWLTLIGKVYTGSDLRYFFAGQLFSYYNGTAGLTGIATAPSIDGASTVAFGTNAAGVPVVAPELPVRARGGFAQIGLPISRWFGRDPEGRNAGWSMYMMYGTDQANTNDLMQAAPGGSRARSDMTVGTLNYKLNKWVSFSYEQSLYRTRANTAVADFPLFEGVHQHEWKDLRSEGGVIFSF